MRRRKREEEPAGALGVVVAARGWVDVVADVSGVLADLVIRPDAQPDAPRDPHGRERLGGIELHPEVVARQPPARWVARLAATGCGAEEPLQRLARRGRRLLGRVAERQR